MGKRDDNEYDIRYGSYPNTKEELVEYIKSNMRASDIREAENRISDIESIPWRSETYIFYIVPKSTPRPRYSGRTRSFYVKDAAYNKKMMEKHIVRSEIIYTRTKFTVTAYLPTPSCSKKDCLLAEMGLIRPISDPDWDNIGKTYSDMIQGILITNDNIICEGITRKFYSIKPRVEIKLEWQENFDCLFNKRRVTSSKIFQGYKDYFGIK